MIADGLTKEMPKRVIGRVQTQLKIMPKQEECSELKITPTESCDEAQEEMRYIT